MFFLHVPSITQPKNQVPRSKGVFCSLRTDTDRQTRKSENSTEDILSGFQEFFLQPIIKDRSNNSLYYSISIFNVKYQTILTIMILYSASSVKPLLLKDFCKRELLSHLGTSRVHQKIDTLLVPRDGQLVPLPTLFKNFLKGV